MKLNKKTMMLLSLCMGIVLIASTAFADSMTKTGYEELKDAIKFTAAQISDEIESGTANMSYVLKDNEEVLAKQTTVSKMDIKNNASETKGTLLIGGIVINNTYNFKDKDGSINYDQSSDTYYVSKLFGLPSDADVSQNKIFVNPFENSSAGDVEKIFDAVIGNLKNYVFVTENEDKSKVFTGSLSDAQIPALVNALVSFASKQVFSSNNNPTVGGNVAEGTDKMSVADPSAISSDTSGVRDITQPNLPKITGDVFVKNVNGKVTVTKDGLIESAYVLGVLSGKDAEGNLHDLSLEVLINFENINSTVITRPDLTGKKVEERNDTSIIPETLSSKFEGTYKVDVITEKSQNLVKIGEKNLVIESIRDGKITGKYFETYKPGYESYLNNTSEFAFESVVDNPYTVQIQFTDKAGKIQNGSLNFDTMTYKINLWLESFDKNKMTDSNFSRVFID